MFPALDHSFTIDGRISGQICKKLVETCIEPLGRGLLSAAPPRAYTPFVRCSLAENDMKSKSSTAKTADYHHGNLRNALIDAGRRALKDIRPQDLSLRYLARMVGVSEAAPSRHFAGLDALLAAIAASGLRELAALRIEIRDSDDTAMSKAYRMMRVYVEFAQRHKNLFGLMIGPRIVARDAHPELAEAVRTSFRLFAAAIEALAVENGWDHREINLVTHAAWSMEHGLATLILSDRVPQSDMPPVPLEQVIDFSIATLLSAVAAGPAHLNTVVDSLPTRQRTKAAGFQKRDRADPKLRPASKSQPVKPKRNAAGAGTTRSAGEPR
jgi:AcrR family transcriptional regulator